MEEQHPIAKTLILITMIIAFCVAGGVVFQGCTSISGESTENTTNPLQEHKKYIGFDAVYSCRDGGVNYTYYRCRLTNVMYVWRQHEKSAPYSDETFGGMTVMMDAETNGPLTYDNWLKRLEEKKAENEKETIVIEYKYHCDACGGEFKVEIQPTYCPGCGNKTEE